jgi:hypothetical protein
MTSDDDLRRLLQKIAATAGDPPEHGLERVAMLRRRRKRHRRGAVAAAMALAVSGIAAAPWLASLADEGEDVTAAAETGKGRRPPTEVPDVLLMECSRDGIDVPVATIRPQDDGMHVVVQNDMASATTVWVQSEQWDSGEIAIDPGQTSLTQPVPPGVLTVGCRIAGADEQRRVDLVDVDRLYTPPELSCAAGARTELTDLPVAEPTRLYGPAVNDALGEYIGDEDEVRPLDGYPDQRFGDPTLDPTVRVVRDGETVAFVHLVGAQGSDGERPPWSSARRVEACNNFLMETDPDPSPTTTDDASGDPTG